MPRLPTLIAMGLLQLAVSGGALALRGLDAPAPGEPPGAAVTAMAALLARTQGEAPPLAADPTAPAPAPGEAAPIRVAAPGPVFLAAPAKEARPAAEVPEGKARPVVRRGTLDGPPDRSGFTCGMESGVRRCRSSD